MNFSKTCFLFVAVVGLGHLSITSALGQNPKTVRVKGGLDAREVMSYKDRYQFDQFTPGKVYFVSGELITGALNYNFLTNQIQFLDPNNDTLVVRDHGTVKMAAIGDSVYYRDKAFGYVQLVGDYGGVKLGRKIVMASIGSDKSVGYGQYVSTGATDNFTSYVGANGQKTQLAKNSATIFSRKTSYFYIDANGRFYPANKGSLMKIYSKYRQPLLDYLDKNEVDYGNKESLKNLMKFSQEMQEATN